MKRRGKAVPQLCAMEHTTTDIGIVLGLLSQNDVDGQFYTNDWTNTDISNGDTLPLLYYYGPKIIVYTYAMLKRLIGDHKII